MGARTLAVSVYVTATLALIFNLYVQEATGATFVIQNQCSYRVWAAGIPVGGGQALGQGQSWSVNVPAGTSAGRFWGRTGCSFDASGKGSCSTGDCGGVLSCTLSGQPPTTLVEYTLNGGNNQDYYDISVIDGFNVPLSQLPPTVAALHPLAKWTSAQMPTYIPVITLKPTLALLVLITTLYSALDEKLIILNSLFVT